jgi:DNA-binding PadR family transcriptional regulator
VSVRHSILAILDTGPKHGYGLKSEFEATTGDLWPLNVGQVYTTLGRLERDELVGAEIDDDGQKIYSITEAGHEELRRWFGTPVAHEVVPRQELAIKLAFAMRAGPSYVAEVAQRQIVSTVRSLQEFTRLRQEAEREGDVAWLLMLEGFIFQAEAEVRWLELCEARLAASPTPGRRAPRSVPAEPQPERSS